MPYRLKNFESEVKQKMYLTVRPYGWIYDNETNGVAIEFGYMFINKYDPEPSMCMHVKGTDHFWCWFITNFKQLSKGDYAKLFTNQLEEFRLDFLLWIKNPDTAKLDWVREYYDIFKGRFYDFSPDEQREYTESKDEWDRIQSDIDDFGDRLQKQKNTMPNQ